MPRQTTRQIMAEIANLLRDRIDIPVSIRQGPLVPGINLSRMTRKDLPSTTYPYRGTLVHVMYAPESPSEGLHAEWSRQVREVLLEAYPNRYRPMDIWPLDPAQATTLIEDPDTAYAAQRTAENAKRASLGWEPLHKIGK